MKKNIFIDTHAHVDDERFANEKPEALISRAAEEGVKYIIAPGVDLESSQKLKDIADKNEGVWFSAGLNCHDAKKFIERDFFAMKKLLNHEKACAIGEVGLDYHYEFTPRSLQKHVLGRFLKLADKTGKPLILHCRESEEDLYEMLTEYEGRLRGVIHCYTGNVEWAKKFTDLGFYLGFTGIVTFKKADQTREVLKNISRDRILTETDSPYMAPVPHRGKTCEPAYVPLIAQKIAEVIEVPIEEASEQFIKNASACFNLNL